MSISFTRFNFKLCPAHLPPRKLLGYKKPYNFIQEHQSMLQGQRPNLNLVHISGEGQRNIKWVNSDLTYVMNNQLRIERPEVTF